MNYSVTLVVLLNPRRDISSRAHMLARMHMMILTAVSYLMVTQDY
jgi:hypothetical protein